MEHERQGFTFDAASAISCGARDYQEDALLADFANGDDLGFVILADGMGGHAAGDIASKIVVTEMFRELTFQRGSMVESSEAICDVLRKAADGANQSLECHVEAHPERKGMGATLVSAVIKNGNLYWISVGDSPLLLYRDGELTQLNEDHSMAGQIDMMVEKGMLSADEAKTHPDRNVLTSVLIGTPIPQVDCPNRPFHLQAGDTLIVASDGLQFLSDDDIRRTLRDLPLSRSKEVADALMTRLSGLNDPELDNISLSVLQVSQSPQTANITPIRPEVSVPQHIAKQPQPANLFKASSGLAAKGRSLFAGKGRG